MTIAPTPNRGLVEAPQTPFIGEHGWPVEIDPPIRMHLGSIRLGKTRPVILTHPGMSDE